MAPSGTTNLAVRDAINCLKFLKKVIPSFGGTSSKITLAGQSSGATMIRALLAAPSASALFQSAILQSDPMVCEYHLDLSLLLKNDLGLRLPDSQRPNPPAGQL